MSKFWFYHRFGIISKLIFKRPKNTVTVLLWRGHGHRCPFSSWPCPPKIWFPPAIMTSPSWYATIAQQKFLRLFVLFCDIFHIAKNVRKSPKFCCDIDKYRKKRQKGAKIFVALLNDNIIYWQYCITLALMEATDKCYPAILIGLLRSLF